MIGRGLSLGVEQQPRGARVAVARLSRRPRVDQPLALGEVERDAGPARTALGLGAIAFVVLYLVPFLKYPPNPPSVGDPATIGDRTALYFGMLAISVLAAIAALRLRVQALDRLGPDRATPAAIGAFVLVVVAAGLVMPGVDEVPAGKRAQKGQKVVKRGGVALIKHVEAGE